MIRKRLPSRAMSQLSGPARMKPIVEQEAAEMGRFWANPVLSFDDKRKGWEKIVRSSDKKLKPFLSTDQVRKLQEMRKEQKEKLQQLNAEQKQEKQN